jgi:hypothetical protein
MLTREQITEALRLAEQAGIALVCQGRAPGGYSSHSVTALDVAAHIVGEINLPASLNGLSPEEYEEWVRLDGSVQCYATTRAGRRCERYVPGRSQRGSQEWKRLNDTRPYCTIHGG